MFHMMILAIIAMLPIDGGGICSCVGWSVDGLIVGLLDSDVDDGGFVSLLLRTIIIVSIGRLYNCFLVSLPF